MFRTAMGHFLVHFLGYSLNSERKAQKMKNRRLPEHFGRQHSHFSLFSSDTFHEAADFLCGFFFHTCRDMGVNVQ